MKANRKFVQADEAVSPVIAVILMVAITVVLAATVFVLVSDIGSQKSAPVFKLNQSNSENTLSVESSDSKADWNRLEITANKVTVKFNLGANSNSTAGTNISTADTFVDITGAANPMSPGEYLDFCGSGGAVADVKITIRDTSASSLIGDWTFTSITACA